MAEPQKMKIVCPGCRADHMYLFCHMPDVPVNVGRVVDTKEQALSVKTGDIELCYCPTCDLVHNVAFDPSRIDFEPGYEVALHHSDVFNQFISDLSDRLVRKYELRDKRILDIGCGCGFFLETLCRLGGNQGIGVDPTVHREGSTDVGEGNVTYYRDFWSKTHADKIGDFVTCQSVFEDIKWPLQFLIELKEMIGDREIPLYFEVYNGFRAFEHKETWSIHFEACTYFSLTALNNIFLNAGYEIVDSGFCYQGDQYLYIEAITRKQPDEATVATEPIIPKSIQEFSFLHSDSIAKWSQLLALWKEHGQSVYLWGSGAKGVNFLTSVDNAEVVSKVIDINPDRQGKFMPGSGHQIAPPDYLKNHSPDKVILTNRIYRDEVQSQLDELGVDCQLLIA